MDCWFNRQIPEGDENTIIIPPASKTFVTGIAPTYYLAYPAILKEYISEAEFKKEMEKLNDASLELFPCSLCFSYGYLFAICTLGLSFLLPSICV